MVESDATIAVTVLDEDGARQVRLDVGKTLLAALQAAEVPIGSVCGGQMSCGTCHVYLDADSAAAPEPEESDLLEDSPGYRPNRSRLACQVAVTGTLSGRLIQIAPDA